MAIVKRENRRNDKIDKFLAKQDFHEIFPYVKPKRNV